MEDVRPPAVAGLFYPDDPANLKKRIGAFLSQNAPSQPPLPPKAFILPHAGYEYSGPVAASGYSLLMPHKDKIKRVVLLGPSHFALMAGMAVTDHLFFKTPLGKIPVDKKAVEDIMHLPCVRVSNRAHEGEHSLEVHLPFLQEVLGEFSLVPVLVGQASPEEVAKVLRLVWGGPETVILISTDLSHFLAYGKAKESDGKTAEFIERLEWEKLDEHRCCGFFPVRGFLQLAKEFKMRGRVIDLRNSGDTAGPRDQVVGYGAFLFN